MDYQIIDADKLDAALGATADAIRLKGGGSGSLAFDLANETGFAAAVAAIPSGAPALQAKTATQNGVVLPDSGYDGLSSVTVNVSGGGPSETLLFTFNQSQGAAYINTNLDVSDITFLSFHDIRDGVFCGERVFKVSEIPVTTNLNSYFTVYYQVSNDVNIQVRGTTLYVSYRYARSASYVSEVYAWSA